MFRFRVQGLMEYQENHIEKDMDTGFMHGISSV